jgi:hypothetical protein
VLNRFTIQCVQEDDEDFKDQYLDLVDCRIPAMKRKRLDCSAIQLAYNSNYMCCFDEIGNFHNDLHKHIAEEHLKMRLWGFKN